MLTLALDWVLYETSLSFGGCGPRVRLRAGCEHDACACGLVRLDFIAADPASWRSRVAPVAWHPCLIHRIGRGGGGGLSIRSIGAHRDEIRFAVLESAGACHTDSPPCYAANAVAVSALCVGLYEFVLASSLYIFSDAHRAHARWERSHLVQHLLSYCF